MVYKEALEWLDYLSGFGSKPGLSRTEELLELMDKPQDKLKLVHVAGTNGKGSVCSCINEVLCVSGYKTGMYTSPHIVNINEMFRVNNEDISDADFASLMTQVRAVSERMDEQASRFEVLTAAAFKYFYDKGCEVAVIEAGLGGRLDSTNVINTPTLAVITSIGMDHVNELGDSLEKIASQKAGIIKEGGILVTDGRNIAVNKIFEEVCKSKNCRMYISQTDEIKNLKTGLCGSSFDYKDIKGIELGLLGLYQPGNAALAMEALSLLKDKGFRITDESIKAGLARVKWQARFEILGKEPYFIVDGSHNCEGVKETLRTIGEYFPEKKVRFILGILSDKNIKEILENIKVFAKEIAVITPPSNRACEAKEMLLKIKNVSDVKSEAFESIGEAVFYMLDSAKSEDLICAMGSLYSVAELKKQWELYTKNHRMQEK